MSGHLPNILIQKCTIASKHYNAKLKLFWWGWGATDIARENGLAVMAAFKEKGVKIEAMETPGGHEWANWRIYLHEVAPKLFR